MQKREKIEVVVVVVLLVILIINVWAVRKDTPKTKIDCNSICIQIGNGSWFFPAGIPGNGNNFLTKEDCVYACHVRFRK